MLAGGSIRDNESTSSSPRLIPVGVSSKVPSASSADRFPVRPKVRPRANSDAPSATSCSAVLVDRGS